MKDFNLSYGHWDLYHKALKDEQRHDEKVQEAIKNNLAHLLSEESIIMTNGEGMARLPVRSMDEYKLRYGSNDSSQVGQGDGSSAVGDTIGKLPAQSQGKGEGAGDQPGVNYYEANVSLDDIEAHLFKDLELPFLEKKENGNEGEVEEFIYRDIRKSGVMGNLDKKRTLFSAMKRNTIKGTPGIYPITRDDLRFKTWEDVRKPESRAVVFALMDTSGSMGAFEKYIARSFFFWMKRFLETKYASVKIIYIAHHTQARVCDEEEFFSKGESGGTICSSVYEKALEMIEESYSPKLYNLYPVHFSDGDNLSSDNNKCVELVKKLTALSTLFSYGEINPYYRQSTLMKVYEQIKNEKNRFFIFKDKQDIYPALKHFFSVKEKATS
ncbi:stress response UPF0229 protein YhbH [Pullulanibacillus camelliae]|uniref:Stress response UPF0229 protein YhbH n=1 Tax=Pullulanibacillus camelliae TaxID=1707096 RepID=A0A8J2YI58_9BACL|nr:sporulation protein YhbH [Pullulanibacillus camelliae]GGE43748.1 stress response UPF0229 protein YhbH [Pullulanibacillus camelliae]